MRKGSIWGKINHFKIEAKQRELISQIRGRRDENIRRAAAEYATSKRTRLRNAFLNIKKSPGEVGWEGRLKAEVSCVEDYVKGVGQIYDDYFKRLDISPTSEGLIEIWWRGIRPYWKRYVEEHRRRIETECTCPSDLGRQLADKYQREAEQILEDFSGTWRVKVEEARSSEKFRRVKEPKSGRRNVGRPPGQTEAVRSLDRRIREIKRYYSNNEPKLAGLQRAQQICSVLDNDKIPLYAAMQRKGLNSWKAALNSKKQQAAIIRRIARI